MDLQNVANLSILDGNVKTIHDKNNRLLWGAVGYDTKYRGDTAQNGNPTPDAPVSVDVVTGTQAVNIYGINLFNLNNTGATSNATFIITNDVLEVTATAAKTAYYSIIIPNSDELKGKTCTLSVKNVVTSAANSDYGKITVYNGVKSGGGSPVSGTIALLNPAVSGGKVTFTFPNSYASGKDCFCLVFFSSTAGADTVIGDKTTYSGVQLEFGSTVSTYSSFQTGAFTLDLGNIELCKFSTYQDYIYKSGDDWYIYKALEKAILTDANTVSANADSANTTRVIAPSALPTAGAYTLTFVCDHFIPKSMWTIDETGMYLDQRNVVFRADKTIIGTTNQSVSAWLGSNNIKIYYVLATPVNIQITDSALISQLNAVHEWLTRYGYNATVSGNLPIIIDRAAL